MHEGRRRSTALACLFVVVLIVVAVGVGAGTAAPARAATSPAHSVWSEVNGPTTNIDRWDRVAKAPDGSLYAGGDFNFDWSGTNGDLMVAKFSGNDAATDHLLWSDTWDNPVEHLTDMTSAIAIDHSGALVVAGITNTASNGWAWVVAKWNTSGGRVWQKTFAASPLIDWDAHAYDVACDAAGNVYVCGMAQTNEYDGQVVSSLVVRKLGGADGHVIWRHSYAGPAHSYNQGSHLALDKAGNVYCTGYGSSARGDSDILVCKFRSSDGRQLWIRRIDGARHRDDEGTGIVVRGTHVWVTGGEYAVGINRVVALARYTTAGKRLWLRTWIERANTTEYPNALAVDGRGDAVVVGSGNDNPVTREHAFILHYSAAGRLQWHLISYDSKTHEAEWRDVICDAAGHMWVGGDTETGSSESFLVARYTGKGAKSWSSAWKGPDGLGGQCNALCFGKTGLFAGGTVTTTAGGVDALAVKYVW